MDENFYGNNHTLAMATPLDIQYKLIETVKNNASNSRLEFIPEQLRNFFTGINRHIWNFFHRR